MEEVHPNLTVVVALYFIIYHLFVTLIVMSFFVAGRNEINVIYRLQMKKKNIDKPLKYVKDQTSWFNFFSHPRQS